MNRRTFGMAAKSCQRNLKKFGKHDVVIGQKGKEWCFDTIATILKIGCPADPDWSPDKLDPFVLSTELFDYILRFVA